MFTQLRYNLIELQQECENLNKVEFIWRLRAFFNFYRKYRTWKNLDRKRKISGG
jgi:hypothetical protein